MIKNKLIDLGFFKSNIASTLKEYKQNKRDLMDFNDLMYKQCNKKTRQDTKIKSYLY